MTLSTIKSAPYQYIKFSDFELGWFSIGQILALGTKCMAHIVMPFILIHSQSGSCTQNGHLSLRSGPKGDDRAPWGQEVPRY